MKQRHTGDKYRPVAEIVKMKNGKVITVLKVSGKYYTLRLDYDKQRNRKI